MSGVGKMLRRIGESYFWRDLGRTTADRWTWVVGTTFWLGGILCVLLSVSPVIFLPVLVVGICALLAWNGRNGKAARRRKPW